MARKCPRSIRKSWPQFAHPASNSPTQRFSPFSEALAQEQFYTAISYLIPTAFQHRADILFIMLRRYAPAINFMINLMFMNCKLRNASTLILILREERALQTVSHVALRDRHQQIIIAILVWSHRSTRTHWGSQHRSHRP